MIAASNALIAFGANMGRGASSPEITLTHAILHLDRPDFKLQSRSRLYRTPCHPPGAGPDFVNAAARYATRWEPERVLDWLHEIEARHGRSRTRRWTARTLDLDLIGQGAAVHPDRETWSRWRDLPAERQAMEAPEGLILPHPRLQDRAFVLVPLAEVAGSWRHPVTGLSVARMLSALGPDASAGIEAIADPA